MIAKFKTIDLQRLNVILLIFFFLVMIVFTIFLQIALHKLSYAMFPDSYYVPILSGRYSNNEYVSPYPSIANSLSNGNEIFEIKLMPNTQYKYLHKSKKGAVIQVIDTLDYYNSSTNVAKTFDLYELAAPELFNPLRTNGYEAYYTLNIVILKWEGSNFWGAINLIPNIEPPLNQSMSIFRINTATWQIETFKLPTDYINTLQNKNLNVNNMSLVYDSATKDNELFLYLYNLKTQELKEIKRYSRIVFSEYIKGDSGYIGYYHPWFLQIDKRQLEPKWIDDRSISYKDFVTGEEVVYVIENLDMSI